MAPKSLSGNRYPFAAVKHKDASLGNNFILTAELKFLLYVNIADDLELKPLFAGQTAVRSLFLLGDIIENTCMALQNLGLSHPSISANPTQNELGIGFTVPAGYSSHASFGAAICFLTYLDALFFERGLKVVSQRLKLRECESLAPTEFFETFSQVFSNGRDGM